MSLSGSAVRIRRAHNYHEEDIKTLDESSNN
ncbi:uncharacterized protein METZ01_LOCUS74263 [marine metagenome]|uniref:Uncharacterized protein n=1 Tax=marine metagenome TaxID=408172 RepID=A0A381TZY0_9ZZZZ